MARLTLPRRTPGSLRAFWLAASSGVAILAGLASAKAAKDWRRLAVAVPVAAAVASPGLLMPKAVEQPYRAWNGLARSVSASLTVWLSYVGSEVLKAEQRRGPSEIVPMAPLPQTGWHPRMSQVAAAYRFQDASAVDYGAADPFVRLLARPGNEWARSLRPVVWLLAGIEGDESGTSAPPSDIYTLY